MSEIVQEFFSAVKSGDEAAALRMIEEYDAFIETSLNLGWREPNWMHFRRTEEKFVDETGEWLLDAAIRAGQLKMMNLLINKGYGRINAQNRNGDLAIYVAAKANKPEAIDVLLEHPDSIYKDAPSTDHNIQKALRLAIENGCLETIKFLAERERGALLNHPNENGLKPIHIAATLKTPDPARVLLDAGADIDGVSKPINGKGGYTAVYLAAHRYCSETAEFLISRGANIELCGDANVSAAEILLESQLLESVINQKKYPVNTTFKNGMTPLTRAMWSSSESAVRILLQNGADANALGSKDGGAKKSRPLELAMAIGWKSITRLLLQYRADPNSMGSSGTALHYVVRPPHLPKMDILHTLLENGADPRIENFRGETPLSIAELSGDAALTGLLLNCPAERAEPEARQRKLKELQERAWEDLENLGGEEWDIYLKRQREKKRQQERGLRNKDGQTRGVEIGRTLSG
ncbi:Ankyrin-2 [Dactylellina cionopaga]|nr:Ankyrin-2 [Dactylellina cionopaga]